MGFLRSDATYDVVHVWKGSFFQLDKHIDRFFKSKEKLRMPCRLSREEIKRILAGCVKKADLEDSYVEMIQTRGMSPNLLEILVKRRHGLWLLQYPLAGYLGQKILKKD